MRVRNTTLFLYGIKLRSGITGPCLIRNERRKPIFINAVSISNKIILIIILKGLKFHNFEAWLLNGFWPYEEL
jgi:hypothetical protein